MKKYRGLTGLLIKDLELLKLQKGFLIAIVVIAVLLGATFPNYTFLFAFLIFDLSMMPMGTINYDEFENGYSFLFTLPITRKTYVVEKYLLGFLAGLLAWILALLCGLLGWKVFGNGDGSLMTIALLYLPSLFLIPAVLFPFRMKYGPEKARMVMIAVLAVILALSFVFLRLLGIDPNPTGQALATAEGPNPTIVGWVGTLVGLVAFGISGRISLGIMNKKEF